MTKRPTNAQIAEALVSTRGMLALAAKTLGISRTTLWSRLKTTPSLRAVAEEQADVILDIAEGHLVSAVVSGDMDQVRFYLRTKGRARGYGDRLEIKAEDLSNEQLLALYAADPDPERSPTRDGEARAPGSADGATDPGMDA